MQWITIEYLIAIEKLLDANSLQYDKLTCDELVLKTGLRILKRMLFRPLDGSAVSSSYQRRLGYRLLYSVRLVGVFVVADALFIGAQQVGRYLQDIRSH
ncbi:hypothetical protein Gotri_008440 [Gossypium trilobum]|uniref:Uncharacterized protein n=1 Tax=Gossypium trilobum TaxID=34281 RepID=A0A7J9EJB6_9ROSI|nr:hypothetical protein [Gossypium trilobum]